MSKSGINRRDFAKATLLGASGLALPAIVSPRVFGKDAPSNTLRIGCIGNGRMGHGDMQAVLSNGLRPGARARVVAVCDADRHRSQHAQRVVKEFYVEKTPDESPAEVDIFDDYRELLARSDIDGVTISTPDHWHGPVAVAAAKAGKDIYVQKPLTYTIGEGQQLVEAVRRNNVVLQTGSQQRSDRNFRHACELVRNGRLGKLQRIVVRVPTDKGTGDPKPMEVPSNLNYNLWLGPTPLAEYTEDRVHSQSSIGARPGWLQIEPYCRGMITGWGSHMFDIAQWGHGSDDSGPIEMEATGEFPDRGLFNVHVGFQAHGRYSDGVELIAVNGDAGVTFEGSDGWLTVGRGFIEAEHPEVLKSQIGDDETRLYVSNNHMGNFLDCMRSREDPICPVETGHRSNTICVLAHTAMKLERNLRWDPQAEQFIDDQEANETLDYEHRDPWA